MKRSEGREGMNESRGAVTASGEISALQDLSCALSSVLESLGILEAYQIIKWPGLKQGINFYDEVSRFEINLILFALKQTGWCQRRAALLLGLKTTTLNYKIKVYNIDCKHPFARETVSAGPSLK